MALPVGHGGIDYPDFGIFTTEHKYPLMIDNAELAVRLGCPQTLERVGQVLLIEQFQYGLGTWIPETEKTGDLVELSSAYFRHIPYAVHLHTHGVEDCRATVERQIDFAYEKTIGLELSFLARASFEELLIDCYVQDGITGYTARIEVDNGDNVIRYATSPTAFTVIDNLDLSIRSSSGWHVLKLVLDAENLEYVRLVLDRDDYSLADIPMFEVATSYRDYLTVVISLVGETGSENDVWIDDVILTVGEPV